MKVQTKLKPLHNLIDLAPLVDVVFLMLIFFIITSDILPLKSLRIHNPELNKDSKPLTSQLIVVMDAQHVLYLGSKKTIVDFNTLKEQLAAEISRIKKIQPEADLSVVVSVDEEVDYGSFLRLFSLVQECCSKIRLVYKPSEEQTAGRL